MSSTEIFNAINSAFSNLANLNEQLYDFWISELYDEEGDLIADLWNEDTVKQMEHDVMMQMSISL
jgi:DNA-binding transcriptional regulator YbjK